MSLIKLLKKWNKRKESHEEYIKYQIYRAEKTERIFKKISKGRSLIDIGSHRGGYSIAFAKMGYDVTGIDIDESKLQTAREMSRSQGLDILFEKGDAMNIPFGDNSFDIAISSNIIEHLSDSEAHLGECHRILRRGGLLYLQFPPYWGILGAHVYAKGIPLPFQYLPFGLANWLIKRLNLFSELDEIGKVTISSVMNKAKK